MIEGTCVGINSGLVGKLKTVRIMDDIGSETTLRIAKNCSLKIGEQYRFYFDNRNQFRTGSGFIDRALATGSFLGYEALPGTEVIEEFAKKHIAVKASVV